MRRYDDLTEREKEALEVIGVFLVSGIGGTLILFSIITIFF